MKPLELTKGKRYSLVYRKGRWRSPTPWDRVKHWLRVTLRQPKCITVVTSYDLENKTVTVGTLPSDPGHGNF